MTERRFSVRPVRDLRNGSQVMVAGYGYPTVKEPERSV